MTASTDALGKLHQQVADTFLRMIEPRQEVIMSKGEPVLDEEGNPRTYTVYPTAAELQAANAFLKANNITAVVGDSEALTALQEKLQAKRALSRNRPAVPDPYAELPPGFGGLQ